MRSPVVLTLLLGLIVLGNAQADVKPAADAPQVRKVSVTGSGTVTVEPDVGKIYVQVTSGAATVGQACGVAANTTDDVITAVEGVEGVNVTTENISVQPNITYGENGKQLSNGFICQQSLLITVNEVKGSRLDASISSALDAAVKAGGNLLQVSSMSTDLSDGLRRTATNQAREVAVGDAQETADILAKAANVKLGEVLSIVDSNVASPSPIPLATPAMDSAQAGAAPQYSPTPIQVGTTEVVATVAIDYAIA